jgi:hypothetical protein
MNFEAKKQKNSLSEKAGYAFIFLLFAGILYFFLKIVSKLPEGWNFFYILLLTASFLILSRILRRIIK